MNNKILFACKGLIMVTLLVSCGSSAKKDNKKIAPADAMSLHAGDENYMPVDPKQTEVAWKGSNSFGAHEGFVSVSKGELKIENNRIVGGTVEVDMRTIEDESHKNNSGLIQHLKDPDFFEVQKFPAATITISKVEYVSGEDISVTGNLTIKGITNPVSFPAKVNVKDGIVTANGKLVIDRTHWGIRYKSGKFFGAVADQTISDDIEFRIKLVAREGC